MTGARDGAGAPAGGGERLVAVGLTDVRSVREILWPAFVAASGTAAGLDYRQEVDMGRLRAEIAGPVDGAAPPDVLVIADPLPFTRAGLLADGAPASGADARPSAWQDPARRWAAVYVQPIVAIYNALYRPAPRSWADLATPGWRRRLVVEAPDRMLTTGPALAELRSTMGDGAWAGWLADIAALEPRQVADNERAVLEVATGSMWGGLANWNVARRVRPGSPVRHTFLDPTPCVPAFAAVGAAGRSPELAHRFVGWLASADGQAAIGRTGRIPAVGPDAASPAATALVPERIGRVAGTADWVADPDAWVATFSGIFPPSGVAAAGKLRA